MINRYEFIQVRRFVDLQKESAQDDAVAIEEPLEIRIAGESIAVTMRTPGDDWQLALGFLFSEGIVSGMADIGRIAHCGRPGTPEFGNVIDVLPAPGTVLDPDRIRETRRGTVTSSACGVCGRGRIDDLLGRCQPLSDGPEVSAQQIIEIFRSLKDLQPTFAATGGVHAAAACDQQGMPLVCFEDVGRHNAVDKTIGALVFDGWPERAFGNRIPTILALSGRASFEMIQKAAVGRLPVVAAVSAPTSLSVSLARDLNLTLLGFTRTNRFTIYSGEKRIV